MSGEDVGQKPMRSGKPYYQATPALQDLGRKVDKMAAKSFPLPAHHLCGQSDLGNPLAEIPSQPGDLEPGRIAPKLRHRHAPAGDPLAKLFNDIFLVAALIGKIDDLASRVRARQIGQHQPVTEMGKECPLSISLFDQNPPHDHPTRRVQPVGLIVDLAQPLLYGAQPAKPALSRFLAPPVLRIHMTRRPASLRALGSRKKGLPVLLPNGLDQRCTLGIYPSPNRKVRSLIDGSIENIRTVKVGIPTYQGVSKMAPNPRQHLFKSPGRRIRRAGAPRLIDDLEALPAAGQRNHQRLIRPSPIVAKVRPFFLYPIKRLDVPVEIHQRKLVSFSLTTRLARKLRPHRLLDRVDHSREPLQVLRGPKPTQKISGRGRVWNPTRSHQPPNRLAPLQDRLILQTRPVGIKRVRQRQHMIRFVVRGMTLKQPQRPVQPLRHPKPPDKLLRQHQPSVMRHLASWIALQMEQGVTHHPPFGLGPRKLFGIYARVRIDVTCALKCDRYFHLGALCFWGYVLSCNFSYTSFQRAFPVLNPSQRFFLLYSAYLSASIRFGVCARRR